MLKNNTSIIDDRGYNQGFKDTPALRKRMARRADWILGEMDNISTKKVLEIGCGTGFLAHYVAKQTKLQVTGSDICEPFIETANQNYKLPNLNYRLFDFNKVAEINEENFDYIIGNGILHHLYYNLDTALLNFKKIIPFGGKVIFIEPNLYNPYVAAIFKNQKLRQWARLEPDEMAFSKSFIEAKLKVAQFTKIKVVYKDFLLPGIPPFLITPSIIAGNILEKMPFKYISQSILISATA